ncbi:MAG: hypothetical protein Q9167_002516 [Letrouitia subvulpina]
MTSDQHADVSDWETREGLPKLTDPFIQQYLQGREALIEQEFSQRSDSSFRQSLTPLAVEACRIISRMRDEEHRTIWSGGSLGELLQQNEISPHPGMTFALAKDRMEMTKTWQIVSKMPKGALLHAHLDAMIDVDWLVDQMMKTDGMSIWADQGLTNSEARRNGYVIFQYEKVRPPDAISIWKEGYKARQCIPVFEAAESFPEGGLEGFKAWVKTRCTITPDESLNHHHGVNAVWQKFKSCFPILDSMILYEPIFRASIYKLLHEIVLDGIRWVDLRMNFVAHYWKKGSQTPDIGHRALFQAFGEEVERFQSTEEGKGFWGCRFIWTTLRSWDKRAIVENMKQCIAIKKSFPHLIAGYDLVGQEDIGRPLADIVPELFWFKKQCMEEGVDIPFFFHAGECLGDGDATDQNLFDAILLGTRRIGHGFSLYRHPLLIEMAKQKKLLIESCPISNEVLRLTSSIKAHPLPALLARGVDVALCNDDPAILGVGKVGLTHDFWQALQGWDNLGLEGLGSLAENSVRFAAYWPDQSAIEWKKDIKDGIFGQGIRAARMREWMSEWNEFCEWIVREFSVDYGSEHDE